MGHYNRAKLFFVFVFLSLNICTLYAQSSQNSQSSQSENMSGPKISVSIGGGAPVNGTFASSPYERVDQLVTRLSEKGVNFPLRDITIKHINGTSEKIDLLKFHRNGDFKNNPYLKNEDVVIFPNYDEDRNFVYVLGATVISGKFQFVEGDKLSDVLELSGGVNKAYENVSEIEITRLSYDGSKETTTKVGLNSDVALQRGDRVRIVANETSRKDFAVYISGEVNMPGYIPVRRNNATLAEVISKSGGLTTQAAGNKAIVFNFNDLSPIYLQKEFGLNFNNKEQVDRLQSGLIDKLNSIENALFLRTSNLTEEDTAYFAIETRLRSLLNNDRVSILNYKDSTSDAAQFILKTGDCVFVPQKEHYVSVFGQVSRPGKILFQPGKDFSYYLEKAGGVTELAKKEIMVIKGETKEWISVHEKNVILEPGDFVFIPKTPVYSWNHYLDVAGKYASIVGGIATTLLLIIQVTKK